MHIEHVALYCTELERMKDFYCRYFGGTSNEKYRNPAKGFESYFVIFSSGARFELMRKTGIESTHETAIDKERIGFTHLAFSCGSKERVDTLTEQIRSDGYVIVGEPRTTGDGYYESVIADPEGNRIELTE